jgi:TonB family protein
MRTLAAIVLFWTVGLPGDMRSTPSIQRFECPSYPELARVSKISGEVRLKLRIAESGTVESATIVSGSKMLAESASKNALTWVYSPMPKAQDVEIIYSYRLKEARSHGHVSPEVILESPVLVVITSRPPLTIEEKVTIPKTKKR